MLASYRYLLKRVSIYCQFRIMKQIAISKLDYEYNEYDEEIK